MPRPQQDDTLQFRLTITCENAAFEDSPEAEIARILRATALRLEMGVAFDTCFDLRDVNGNVVGQASLKTVYEHDNARWHDRKARRAASALLLGVFLALGAWGCAAPCLATTTHLPADAAMSDAFPASKGDPR